MSLRIGGSGEGERRRRRRLVFLAVGGTALVTVWVVIVLALGIGQGPSGEEQPQVTADAEQTTEASREGRSREQEAPTDGTGADEEDTGAGDHEGHAEGEALSNHDEEKDVATPEDPERFMREEQRRDEAAQGGPRPPEGGATHEPHAYDPLGIEEQEVPLTPTGKSRVEAAASNFVTAAYGYTGEKGSGREYLSGVNQWALSPEFHTSEGAEEVDRYQRSVEESGTKSAARMSRWDVGEAGEDEIRGTVYFETADAYDGRTAELVGEKKTYRQELTLVRYRAVFKVQSAGKVQEVRIGS